jgi:hypothetical protein
MNQRIYELAKQADLIEFEPIGDSNEYTPNHTSVVKARKFAQLIVRECAVFVENDDYRGVTLSDRLKQHFGVEE